MRALIFAAALASSSLPSLAQSGGQGPFGVVPLDWQRQKANDREHFYPPFEQGRISFYKSEWTPAGDLIHQYARGYEIIGCERTLDEAVEPPVFEIHVVCASAEMGPAHVVFLGASGAGNTQLVVTVELPSRDAWPELRGDLREALTTFSRGTVRSTVGR